VGRISIWGEEHDLRLDSTDDARNAFGLRTRANGFFANHSIESLRAVRQGTRPLNGDRPRLMDRRPHEMEKREPPPCVQMPQSILVEALRERKFNDL